MAIATWPETTLISRKTMTARHLRRRRAAAREKWPMYMADVAYRIERLPPPRPPLRTDLGTKSPATTSSPASPRGFRPWACEALKPEHRPRTMTLAEILAPYTEDELAAYYY